VAVVWVGYDDQRPTGLTGSSGAMRVWKHLFQGISASPVNLDLPADIHMVWIDRATGLRSDKRCENAVELPYIRGSEPDTYAGCDARSPLDWLKKLFK
jgi:penicillin-binding protein 1B